MRLWDIDVDICRHQVITKHEQEMKDLGDVGYAMELKCTQREDDAHQEFESLMDDLKNKVRRVY